MKTHSGENLRILVCGAEKVTEVTYTTVRTHSGKKSCNVHPRVWHSYTEQIHIMRTHDEEKSRMLVCGLEEDTARGDGREPATMNIGES